MSRAARNLPPLTATSIAAAALAFFACSAEKEPPSGGGTGGAGGATAGQGGSSAAGRGSGGAAGSAGSTASGGSSGSASGGAGGIGAAGSGGTALGGAGQTGGGSGGALAGASMGGSAAGGSPAAGSGGTAQGGASAGTAGGGTAGGGMAGTGAAGGGGVFEPSFILGADISSVQEAMDGGTRYADVDGTEKSIFEILKAHGFNYVRLRTFVEPLADYGYATCGKEEAYCDKDHTIEFAQDIKAAGMGFLLDFHYSDTWADPGKQVIPEAWRSASTIGERAELLKAYTKDVLNGLVAAGARPDMVQVGNEITPGMMIHVPSSNTDCWGNNSTPASLTGSTSNWDNLATLLKAGIAGVREVDPNIRVMLHIENTESASGVRSWVSSARQRGVEFDVLGLSCYTEYQGEPSVWRNTFETLADDFPDLAFAIAEYNPERSEANRIMRDLPDGRGLGTFFWEPTQSGAWGDSLFTSMGGGVLRANASDFAEYDELREELGL